MQSTQLAEIVCTNIHKTYKMGETLVKVLRGIDLEIYKSQMTVVLGASGSGKSTLLNIVGGLDKPTSGQVVFSGDQPGEHE